MPGAACKTRSDTRIKIIKKRQHGMAQTIARDRLVEITFILDPSQPILLRPFQDFATRNIEQRSQQQCATGEPARLWHRRQPLHPAATQQVQQQRFRLIVAMLGQQQRIAILRFKNRVARMPRGSLKPQLSLSLNAHALDPAFNIQRSGAATGEFSPVVGIRRQAVMDMDRRDFTRNFFAAGRREMEQRNRIEPAGKSDAQTCRTGGLELANQEGFDPRSQIRQRRRLP